MDVMELPQRTEQFSRAYVHAIAAVAGANVLQWSVDDDSIDVGFGVKSKRRARLEAQLKCTYAHEVKRDGLAYPLPVKNYDDLRAPTLVPRILIVLVVPPEPCDWLDQTASQLVLRRCAWWTSLRGAPDTNHETSVTVKLPYENLWTPGALQGLLAEAGAP